MLNRKILNSTGTNIEEQVRKCVTHHFRRPCKYNPGSVLVCVCLEFHRVGFIFVLKLNGRFSRWILANLRSERPFGTFRSNGKRLKYNEIRSLTLGLDLVFFF